MSKITFADVVHYSISFSKEIPAQALLLELIDTPWVQRLRDISQTANTRLVYMFSEHSRFGHSLGVAHLAELVMQSLEKSSADAVSEYRLAVAAAALLHDLGHIAPGSHTAYKTWFPDGDDQHEEISCRIIKNDIGLNEIFKRYDQKLPDKIVSVLSEDAKAPAWTRELISGGGWNADRGNWCVVDSIMAGTSYGKYNIPALTDALVITPDGHLALRENRLDAMMHFAMSRHAMYRQIYQHRVLLAADMLNKAIAKRARMISTKLNFCDDTMQHVLSACSAADLSLEDIFNMREAWWRYHLMHWAESDDNILADLASRLLNRNLFKTVRVREDDNRDELIKETEHVVKSAGFDPEYYLHVVSNSNVNQSDYENSMLVMLDDGRVLSLSQAEPLFESLVAEAEHTTREWLVVPAEAKKLLGRER
ncbi:MAG: HD domain-containing protein [Candidatus Dadabacteria bacterium]|nr:MAG: HD domain-containing protein [Candidatus Dadabacteria bacterium]